jgi:hypothetical protein
VGTVRARIVVLGMALGIAIFVLVSALCTAVSQADDNIDHGPFYRSTLSVACFVDKGEYPHDGSTARWACWRVVNLKYVNTSGFRTVYRGKLGKLYGTSWGERDDLTYDGQSSKAKSSRLKYEPTYFCYGRSSNRRTWECFRDIGVVPEPYRWIKDELPKTCNDLTTYYIDGRRDNPMGPTRSTCR